jgi:GT2 family glycosyltransferase
LNTIQQKPIGASMRAAGGPPRRAEGSLPQRRLLAAWLGAAAAIVAAVTAISVVEVKWLWNDVSWKPALLGITIARHLIELICVGYAIAFFYAAIRYVTVVRRQEATQQPDADQHVSDGNRTEPGTCAIIYLCCNDLEEEAVRELSTLRYDGRLLHILHDDSTDPAENARVDRFVDRLAAETGVRWHILRRPEKQGGKPGATQYILHQTAHEHDYFLLLDNDSYVPDPDVLRRALPCFRDDRVAGVQFRNCTRHAENEGPFARIVAGAVDIFDAFASGLFEKLWRPFVGHNAMLRTADVCDAGGFTPGVFADDIDLTVRMNLRGRRIVYRRDLVMEECHPSNYRSFALRSKKWAHGCAQILRMHLLNVLASGRMTFREKLGFLMFTGFYVTQVLMLLYMLLVFIVLPLMIGPVWKAAWWALFIGTIVPASIFLPVAAYLMTEGRRRGRPFWRTLGGCAATYGSTDLWTILGLAGGLRRDSTKKAKWVPTNSVLNASRPLLDWSHFAAGGTFLLVPLAFQPELLLFPLTWLFAGKFLFVPAVAVHYGADASPREPRRIDERKPARLVPTWLNPQHTEARPRAGEQALAARALLVLGAIALFSFSAAAFADEESATQTQATPTKQTADDVVPDYVRIEVRGRDILIDGESTIIRGIHYGPWRPGTGPGRGFPYPSNDELRPDLRMIRSLNANTILVYDPPARLLDLAMEKELNVIYTFNIEWWRVADEAEIDLIGEEMAQRVEQLREHPAVIAWMLGNETPAWIIDQLQPAGVRAFFTGLREQVRAVDPHRPVTHGNWPLTRTFDFDQTMDIVSYNLYPFYPTEVAVNGFGRFIRDFLMPRVGDRPLIISEFGINTLEATPEQQAEIVSRCWYELLEAGANGGVVFAFADEWWKNYDNPIRPPDYWRRVDDPDDHLTHNQDPEEHYGIVTAYREPKPAFDVVRKMFAESYSPGAANPGGSTVTVRQVLISIGTIAVLGVIAIAVWLWLKGMR